MPAKPSSPSLLDQLNATESSSDQPEAEVQENPVAAPKQEQLQAATPKRAPSRHQPYQRQARSHREMIGVIGKIILWRFWDYLFVVRNGDPVFSRAQIANVPHSEIPQLLLQLYRIYAVNDREVVVKEALQEAVTLTLEDPKLERKGVTPNEMIEYLFYYSDATRLVGLDVFPEIEMLHPSESTGEAS